MASSSSAAYALPLHRLSVGDGILVYWGGDRKWYPGEITAAAGDHGCEVLYQDGEREWISLDKTRYILRRDRKGCIRGRNKKPGSGSGEEEIKIGTIKDILFDIEDRIPLQGVYEDNHDWWKVWHARILLCVEKNDIEGLMDSTLTLSQLLKPKITSTWWSKHHTDWKRRLENVTSFRDAVIVVKDLQNHAINWSIARKLFLDDDDPLDMESADDAAKAGMHHSTAGLICSICRTGAASNFFVQCKNAACGHAFHTFCLHPPLESLEKDWLCPYCDGDYLFASKLTKGRKFSPRKVQSMVGHRRVILEVEGKVTQDQFLVKWESLSHHHDSWVPLEWLYIFDRVRLHNFQKKYPLKETDLMDQRKPEWFKIDRVIACRRKFNSDNSCEIWSVSHAKQDTGEFEFLVKWMGLDYCDATWESSCTPELLAEVGNLVLRHQRATERAGNDYLSCSNGPFGNTPDDLYGDTLHDYQLQGLKWILSNYKARRNVILADEMGLGKTVQVVCFVQFIMQERFNVRPVLVIAPKSILFQWEKEFHNWAKDLNVVIYQGDKQSRRCIQSHEMYSSDKRVLFDALVTNYELVLLESAVLKKFKWSVIIVDEAHKIKNLDCKLASCLKHYNSEFRLLLTGTPLQNTLLELFALLHFIDPLEFSDPKSEAESFSAIETGIHHSYTESKIAQIHELLKPRMLRRLKSDVLPGAIPIKKWVEVPCSLTDFQRELYINILEKNYKKLNQGIQSGRKIILNFILAELRKCCNHPMVGFRSEFASGLLQMASEGATYLGTIQIVCIVLKTGIANEYLFPGQETSHSTREAAFSSLAATSGKLELLEKLLPKLKERGNRVLLFSQMTKMLDILEDFLLFLGIAYSRIDGKTSLATRQQQMKEFNNPESQVFVFLISTRAGGLGIDLPSADRVIIYDPDFNPFMDLQAQSRAHRIGQTRPVVVYQLITKCSVEEKILQKSKQKLAIENLVMNPSKKPTVSELHSILLHRARTILNRKKVHATTIHYDDRAIEALLKLDPTPGENCSSDDNGYLGSIQSFIPGATEDEEPPHSPKVEEWKEILGPVAEESGDFGRGKRQKVVVKYEDEDGSDSDEVYSPEGSTTSGGSSTDDSNDDSRRACGEI